MKKTLASILALLALAVPACASTIVTIGTLGTPPVAGSDPEAWAGQVLQLAGTETAPGTINLTCDAAGTCTQYALDALTITVGANSFSVLNPLLLLDAPATGEALFQISGITVVGSDTVTFASSAYLPSGTVPAGFQMSLPDFGPTAADTATSSFVYYVSSASTFSFPSGVAAEAYGVTVPEPQTWAMAAFGLAAFAAARRLRRIA